MASIQYLKKKLRGILSTQKLAKAMKTVSTVKFSRLNSIYGKFSAYGKQCAALYEAYRKETAAFLPPAADDAPVCMVILGADKGLCGNFNTDLFTFALSKIREEDAPYIITCGKKAVTYFKEKKIPVDQTFFFGDTPAYDDAGHLLKELIRLRAEGRISAVRIIYPRYRNMMLQMPTLQELFEAGESKDVAGEETLFFPDRETFIGKSAKEIFQSMLYQMLLETALGAQAATLMTMRSAYDTATEYRTQLESQINRERQSAVTADVIETSSERE